jgi:peroxiredoxin
MIKIGDEFPAVTVQEFVPEPVDGCVVGVNQVDTHKALANKKVAIFALPGKAQ